MIKPKATATSFGLSLTFLTQFDQIVLDQGAVI